MKKVLSLILLAGLVTIPLVIGGCVAPETTTPATGTSGSTGFLSYLPIIIILILLFGMFYFLMVRPMRQREKRHDEMVQQLQVGTRVITAGGVYGDIVSVSQDSVVVKIESGATMRVTKGSILAVRPTEGE